MKGKSEFGKRFEAHITNKELGLGKHKEFLQISKER